MEVLDCADLLDFLDELLEEEDDGEDEEEEDEPFAFGLGVASGALEAVGVEVGPSSKARRP